MVDIDSAQATTIVDSSSQSLLEELNTKRRRWLLWPWALGAAGLALLLLAGNDSPRWLLLTSAVACAIGVALVAAKDQLRKSAVVLYDLDSSMEEALNRLYEGANHLASASAAWHVSSSARVHDSKYHAGAGHVIARASTRFTYSPPPFVRTNVRTVAVNVGTQTLHFFPDRVLIYDKDGVGAVSYPELRVNVSATNFVEEGGVPVMRRSPGTRGAMSTKKAGLIDGSRTTVRFQSAVTRKWRYGARPASTNSCKSPDWVPPTALRTPFPDSRQSSPDK
ncbi:hypothetical protein MP631_18590 [Xanthomonas phaseoli pv. phaseoli]|nr:hypothetical protein MP631_18590 [Xanthomonas phaseoli pv. phaseoli]